MEARDGGSLLLLSQSAKLGFFAIETAPGSGLFVYKKEPDPGQLGTSCPPDLIASMGLSPEGSRETLLLIIGPWQAGQAGQETIPQTEPEAYGESSLRSIDSRMLLDIVYTASRLPLPLPQFPHFTQMRSGRAKQAQQF